MEAKLVAEIPTKGNWQYEPKFDGFRGLVFRDRETVIIQSKAGQPLERYFPELVAALLQIPDEHFVIDGEIVVSIHGHLDFDALLQRIHPAASRIQRLSRETPASINLFDLLETSGRVLTDQPLRERRKALQEWAEQNLQGIPALRLAPVTHGVAQANRWLSELAGEGYDGVIAKLLDEPYHSGDRRGMQKIKRIRTADCVVGGFRYASKGGVIGSLLLGLYNENGKLDHIGYTSSFTAEERADVAEKVQSAMPQHGEPAGFTGSAPGGPSRWNAYNPRAAEWTALVPKLVVEVSYDHFSGGRFRHGTKIVRWRPDKDPHQCTKEQVAPVKTAISNKQ
jgi:ATP-dependent DNA ligase